MMSVRMMQVRTLIAMRKAVMIIPEVQEVQAAHRQTAKLHNALQ